MAELDRDRKAMLAKVHIARKDLALDEATYRGMIARISAGRTDSAGRLRFSELHDLLQDLRAKGWKPKAATTARGRAKDPQSRMIRGIWLQLADAGVVRDRSEASLRAYVKRMTGADDMRFLASDAKSLLIEELKAWASRAGVKVERC